MKKLLELESRGSSSNIWVSCFIIHHDVPSWWVSQGTPSGDQVSGVCPQLGPWVPSSRQLTVELTQDARLGCPFSSLKHLPGITWLTTPDALASWAERSENWLLTFHCDLIGQVTWTLWGQYSCPEERVGETMSREFPGFAGERRWDRARLRGCRG